MDVSSFATSLGTSFFIFLVLVLLYSWLSSRPGNAVVYYPNKVIRGVASRVSAAGGCSPFGWIREAVKASEDDVVKAGGVDAATYLIFLTTAMGIMVLSGLMLVPILLPLARTDNNIDNLRNDPNTKNVTFSDLDKLGMGNIKERSPRLWAFVIGTYWVTIVSFIILFKAYKHVSNLRAAAKASPNARPEDFAMLVRDLPSVPKGQTRKEQVDNYFSALHPDTFYKSMVVTDNKQADKIWKELEGYRKKLAHAEAVFEESKTTQKPEGTRPTCRTGFLGILGSKVDTINYCNEKINELLPKLEAEQKATLRDKQLASAVVFFNSRSAAASASQTLHAQMVDRWTIMEAPEPRQMLWSNLSKKIYERQIRQCIVYAVVFLTVVFYMIPITFVSAFTTLSNLKKLLPFLKKVLDEPAVRTILEAYLPQIALIVFLALLPKFLMFLSKFEGIPSESHAVRSASGKYFYFIIFNVFLGVTIGGALISSIKTVAKKPGQIIPLLGSKLPGNAVFFLTFVALKFFVGYGLELSRIIPLVIYHLKRRFLCKTENERKEAWAPGDLGYAKRVPNDMLIVTICLCYSVIAPLIIPFGVLYFGLGWLVLRNQILNVYVPSFESYGRMWPHMHIRIIASLIIYQLTMIGYFSIKKFIFAPLLLPLPFMSFIFGYLCHHRFYLAFVHTPLEIAIREEKGTPVAEVDAAYREFIPVSLRPQKMADDEKFDDAEFEDARSQMSRSASLV